VASYCIFKYNKGCLEFVIFDGNFYEKFKMIKKSFIISGAGREPIAIDIYVKNEFTSAPIIIYAHGFCGFKDWGNVSLIAEAFVNAGLVFACFNFSHNGTSLAAPEDFVRLDLFAENNFTKQLFDFKAVLDFFGDENDWQNLYDRQRIGIIGHSMGGGMALITALENDSVKALSTWASVIQCNTPFGKWDEVKMNEWKNSGTAYYQNGRTKQDLPMNYQLAEDALTNALRLNIKERINELNKPVLICHGSNDESVPYSAAEFLKESIKNSKLITVNSDHVFGRKHPYKEIELPLPMQTVLNETINFFKEIL
jgi:pimeloyl-ACP methyl ester carboxylesterase